jgi:hypothetical protein
MTTGSGRPVAVPQLVSADVATALQSGRSGLLRPVGVRKAAARWSLPSMLTNDVLYGHAGCRSIGDTWGRRRSQVLMSNTGEIARADHGGRRGNAGHCVEFGHGSRCSRWCWVTGGAASHRQHIKFAHCGEFRGTLPLLGRKSHKRIRSPNVWLPISRALQRWQPRSAWVCPRPLRQGLLENHAA